VGGLAETCNEYGPRSARQAAIARIHIAKKSLRLSDELYRAIIARVTGGKRSSAALNSAERGRLLDELRRLGFQSGTPRRGELGSRRRRDEGSASSGVTAQPGSWIADEPQAATQARMIHLLWWNLGRAAKLRDASDRGLRHFVRRQTGRDALEWLSANEANGVIEGLKAWRRRVARQE
jgi:phage gp16-like protein